MAMPTKKFGGVTYHWVTSQFSQAAAKELAAAFRSIGYKARVVKGAAAFKVVPFDIYTSPKATRSAIQRARRQAEKA